MSCALGAPEKNLASTLSRALRAPERLMLVERDENAPNGHPPLSVQAELLSLSRAQWAPGLYDQPVLPATEEVALKQRIDVIATGYPMKRLESLVLDFSPIL